MKPGTYLFKTEFWKAHNINHNIYDRRKDDLLKWLENFYDYELTETRPIKIIIKQVFDDYQPLPKKGTELKSQKLAKYEQFTIAALGNEFKPNSKARIAREAIYEFGEKEYGHYDVIGVANRFVKPAFDKHAESNGRHVWVWYETYIPLDEEDVNEWRNILREEHISEDEMKNAFMKHADGGDISTEVGYFKKARERFKKLHGTAPILVSEWKCRHKEGK